MMKDWAGGCLRFVFLSTVHCWALWGFVVDLWSNDWGQNTLKSVEINASLVMRSVVNYAFGQNRRVNVEQNAC